MKSNFNKGNKNRILFLSFNYYPDQSAGAIRSKILVRKIDELDKESKIFIFCSRPIRYGQNKSTQEFQPDNLESNVKIIRFWVPFLGQSPLNHSISYSFFFFQALLSSFFIRPTIIFVTTAKLLTGFLAAISSKFTGAKLYIDVRDTFTDNFLYFYRWKKRVFLVSFFLLIENFILRSSYSINIVSEGFKEAFYGCQKIIKKRNILLTNFTNGIEFNKVKLIRKNINKKIKNHYQYQIHYAGNIGEAQDLLSLLINLNKDKETLKKMIASKIKIVLYGSGSQLILIKELLNNKYKKENLLSKVVSYKGLLSREEIFADFCNADCLFLNLGLYKSLSMVIPTKLFEYAATPFPIIFSANGFTKNFINKIDGTILFDPLDAKTLLRAINKSKKTKVNLDKRNKFLENYDAELIYEAYAQHLLNN